MTNIEIINMIKEKLNESKEYYLTCEDRLGENHGSTLIAYGEYHAFKFLLMDIKEKELLEQCEKQSKEVKELLNNENNI